MTEIVLKIRLDEITSGEMHALQRRHPVILLPLGSQEDQGAHAPMGDFQLASRIAERIARRATDAGTLTLAAPTLPFGAADFFGATPGGLALTPATFKAVLTDLIGDLRRNGLTRIIILNGHGGNVPIIHEVTRAIRQAGGPFIPSVYLWKIARQLMARHIGPAPARFGHAGEPLGSIALSLRPDAARPDLVVPPVKPPPIFGCAIAGFGNIQFEDALIDAPLDYRESAPNSAAADATQADAALGALVVDELVALVARFCAHCAAQS